MTVCTALICTRNRSAPMVRAARSLLLSADAELELIVVDQSDGDETREALLALGDARLRYLKSAGRGKGFALNEGLQIARGEIVACTDDDCEAPPGWARAMTDALLAQKSAAVLFCNVLPVAHDRAAGYVPAYQRSEDRLVRTLADTCRGHGLGAGMAVRREVLLKLGGFDPSVGPGARFPSGDDWDVTQRLILRGWHAFESSTISIVHDGFRSFAEGREHARRDWLAIGAVCAKPLRAGHGSAAIVALWEFFAHAVWPPCSDLFHLRRPRGLARITGFLRGFAGGLGTPVDRATLLFENPGER